VWDPKPIGLSCVIDLETPRVEPLIEPLYQFFGGRSYDTEAVWVGDFELEPVLVAQSISVEKDDWVFPAAPMGVVPVRDCINKMIECCETGCK